MVRKVYIFISAYSDLAIRSGSDVEGENISDLTLVNCARGTAAVPEIQSGRRVDTMPC